MTEFTSRPPQDGVSTLTVDGDVDIATVQDFLAEARGCLHGDATTVEIDLSGVTFIDSSGLGALVRLRKEATDLGKVMVLARVPSKVWRIFEVTGLTGLFEPATGG